MTNVALSIDAPVPSPCTDVCRIDSASGLCEGCLRTIDEIVAWSTMPSVQKLVVWDALPQRRINAAKQPAPGSSSGVDADADVDANTAAAANIHASKRS